MNFIRTIVDQIKIPKAPEEKKLIPLSIGDPSVFGNFNPPKNATDAIIAAVVEGKSNGYAPAHGHVRARTAVATKYTKPDRKALTPDDIIISNGCSEALKFIIHSSVGEGSNILCPFPGFTLYCTLATNNFAEIRGYNLFADKRWECDFKHLETLVDSNTKAIIINNPSNPCGANYSVEHLLEIVAFARKHKLLIIADEIYGNMVFNGETFTSFAEVCADVPLVVAGGIAKQYLAPGWRLGWLIFYDIDGALKELYAACVRMSQLVVGCNALMQRALPNIILETPQEYYSNLNAQLEAHAMCLYNSVSDIPGLKAIKPQGAMYMMIKITMEEFPTFKTDLEFTQALLDEEFVFVLPGLSFNSPGFIRCVFCAPLAVLEDAGNRIRAFCLKHRVAPVSA